MSGLASLPRVVPTWPSCPPGFLPLFFSTFVASGIFGWGNATVLTVEAQFIYQELNHQKQQVHHGLNIA
jgi:hypothetical protein